MNTCDRCGIQLTKNDRSDICMSCELTLADDVISGLEAENTRLKAERSAAVEDLKRLGSCTVCKHNGEAACVEDSGHEKCFAWRGAQEGAEG
ncbi:MAG: hypothetical protein VB081_10085 [Christensenella sp.]|uniref:hypothetical protein n=1 Tax=Christensenella sp. TaxID=1935934 RepID=UPI002B21243D|nr:hypothetical protein [Christensenella sp.]MEA5003835.1 hypothetical protein [Christensenella sp.]